MHALSRSRIWVVLAALPLQAQGFHAGVRLGVPLTEYFETGPIASGNSQYEAATRRYVVGATLEWRWTHAFGFETDALYQRLGYAGTVNVFNSASGGFSTSAISVTGGSWDIPLMAKYRFGRAVRPYLAGGGVLRYVGPLRATGEQTTGFLGGSSSTTAIDTTEPAEFRKRDYPGLTAVGGIEFGAGRLRIEPEFRYVRWTASPSGPYGLLRFSPNQAELMVGVLF